MPKPTPAARFWTLVQRSHPDACWAWHGPRDGQGRPAFSLGKTTTAARALWQLTRGERPGPHQVVRHLCQNLECVNPTHLVLADKGFPNQGPGEKAPNAKLTEAQAREILAARGTVTAKILAAQYGVSVHTISTLWKGQSWKHLREEAQE